jgi:predicted adenine nucleotide alpha hydrolase (AANH) superfamily ATPase
MTISRKKNAIFINEIGQNLENENVSFLVSDFKKKGGQEKGIAISKELNMYRQSFCGCKYSKKD